MIRLDTKKPQNLLQLLKRAAPIVWKGKAAERTMIRNVEEAASIMNNPKLSDINTALIDEYRMALSGYVAPQTVNYKMVNLHRILKFGYEREWLERMPKFEYFSVNTERERVFTDEEVQGMLTYMREHNMEDSADFFEILYLTGMRKGELLKAQPEDVQGSWLFLKAKNTKTKTSRKVPLCDRAKELIQKKLPFQMTSNCYGNHWNKARIALGYAGDSEFVPHVLRHTRATMALSKTRNIRVVQKLLGHNNIKTTMRYAKVLDDDLMEAVG